MKKVLIKGLNFRKIQRDICFVSNFENFPIFFSSEFIDTFPAVRWLSSFFEDLSHIILL